MPAYPSSGQPIKLDTVILNQRPSPHPAERKDALASFFSVHLLVQSSMGLAFKYQYVAGSYSG